MQEQQKIEDYQELEECAASFDFDWLEHKINTRNYAFCNLLETKLDTNNLLANFKPGFKLDLHQKFQLKFLKFIHNSFVHKIISGFGLGNLCFMPCLFIWVLLWTADMRIDKDPILASFVSVIEQTPWMAVGISSTFLISGLAAIVFWIFPQNDKTRSEFTINNSEYIKSDNLRHLLAKLTTMNLNPEIQLVVDFGWKKTEVNLIVRPV